MGLSSDRRLGLGAAAGSKTVASVAFSGVEASMPKPAGTLEPFLDTSPMTVPFLGFVRRAPDRPTPRQSPCVLALLALMIASQPIHRSEKWRLAYKLQRAQGDHAPPREDEAHSQRDRQPANHELAQRHVYSRPRAGRERVALAADS